MYTNYASDIDFKYYTLHFSHVSKCLVRNTLVTMFSLYSTVLYIFLSMSEVPSKGVVLDFKL